MTGHGGTSYGTYHGDLKADVHFLGGKEGGLFDRLPVLFSKDDVLQKLKKGWRMADFYLLLLDAFISFLQAPSLVENKDFPIDDVLGKSCWFPPRLCFVFCKGFGLNQGTGELLYDIYSVCGL